MNKKRRIKRRNRKIEYRRLGIEGSREEKDRI